jgi:hypothetical protein|tara:strand:- start:465 stop:725 length:261 start_codon:yes stop_codon:yes gene_type:complete
MCSLKTENRSYGLNRYVCTVLEEMRQCTKNLNFSVLPSLIEEVQILVNRMEAKLHDIKDLDNLHDRIKEKKLILSKLEEKIKKCAV